MDTRFNLSLSHINRIINLIYSDTERSVILIRLIEMTWFFVLFDSKEAGVDDYNDFPRVSLLWWLDDIRNCWRRLQDTR